MTLLTVQHVDRDEVERIVREEFLSALVELGMAQPVMLTVVNSNEAADSSVPRYVLTSPVGDPL